MKKFKINEKLCKKLTAYTLMTTMTFSSASKLPVYANNDNMCYTYEVLTEYDVNGDNYVVERSDNNSIRVTQKHSKGENVLTIDNNGEVTIITQDGYSSKREVFNINEFNATNLDVNENCIKNKDLKKCVKTLENYFNSNSLYNENPLEKIDGNLVYDSTYGLNYENGKELAKKQYNDVYSDYMCKLDNKSNIDIKALQSTAIAIPLGYTGALAYGGELGKISIVSSALSGPQVTLFLVVIAGALAADYFIDNNQIYSIDDVLEQDILTTQEVKSMGLVTVSSAMEGIKDNYNDNNQNNDYYIAYLCNNGKVYINFINPLSIDEAKDVLLMGTPEQNIYSLTADQASEVIWHSGGIPGTSSSDDRMQQKAECHAYSNSHKSFNVVTKTINNDELTIDSNARKGLYYWHYHFHGKNVNDKHSFFGTPVKVK